ncbi:unnamed protein product [Penicillium roqueforti FM164]|uniref:Genomic scaffold, ProqFM164S01 n=1 Tax=Penicillium roqueforti (strain FM164) TaxID=1365484 RepID=W6Q5N6_PENRF|nr:unnamed protein product [Penicillium roqueforti FM164]
MSQNDYYLEGVDSSKAAAEAHYLCIPKGEQRPCQKKNSWHVAKPQQNSVISILVAFSIQTLGLR